MDIIDRSAMTIATDNCSHQLLSLNCAQYRKSAAEGGHQGQRWARRAIGGATTALGWLRPWILLNKLVSNDNCKTNSTHQLLSWNCAQYSKSAAEGGQEEQRSARRAIGEATTAMGWLRSDQRRHRMELIHGISCEWIG